MRTNTVQGQMTVCPFCKDRPATLLCDFVIGFLADLPTEKEERHYSLKTGELTSRIPAGTVYIASEAEMFTCDRPICVECTTCQGSVHYCGKHCEHDTIDLCPQCKDTEPDGCRPLTREQAASERQEMWKRSGGMAVSLSSVEPKATSAANASS